MSELFAELCLARSYYFYHRGRLPCPDKYASVRFALSNIFERNHRCYGYRRMRAALRREQCSVPGKVVRRLMRQEQLKPAGAKRRRYRSYCGEISPAPDNLINRDFRASAPNRKWLTDLTEFQIPAGKVYLSPVIDCFDGLVVSWSLGTRPDAGPIMPCWVPPPSPLPGRLSGRWGIPIADPTIAGPGGSRGYRKQNSSGRCHVRGTRRTTQPVKVFSGD